MNHLAKETSPYLLQHKNNPVDWHPWGQEALQKALDEDKVIILSIGYSACHWCHVMEHESFENDEVAKVMNTFFVNIKVDREERPDIDGIYMEALQNMGLRGGWPLNVFLMPNTKPFYGGTYFPKKNWINLLYGIQESFKEKREALEESAEGFAQSLNNKDSEKYLFGNDQTAFRYDSEELNHIEQKLSKDFDRELGGMNRAPKFPMPSVWNLVLNLSYQLNNAETIVQLQNTLDRIALGGIYDHLAGGWTRYSTDERWKIPHFEKMLYDNGQLLSLYTKTFLFFSSKKAFTESFELYKWAVELSINWLKTEMTSELGGFYAALDADSEGEEGKYYVWTSEEITEVLSRDSEEFQQSYEFSQEGNWEHGNNVLHLEALPKNWEFLLACHKKLENYRKARIRPGLDNKIICGWNGLMLTGLIEAYKTFGVGLDLIENNIRFIERYLISEFRNVDGAQAFGLWHQYDVKKIPAFLDDYAAIIEAFIQYYQVSFEEKWLFKADSLLKYTLANFFDPEELLFYFTDIEGEKLIARKKEIFDNVIPASNSMMIKNLYFLGRFLNNSAYSELAKSIFSKIKPLSLKDPQWLSNWTDVGLLMSTSPVEITVFGQGHREIVSEIQMSYFNPNVIYFGADKPSILPEFEGRMGNPKEINIYVCVDKSCHLPVKTAQEALKLLK
ncbi:thioredoxin domain-containing protein [Lacihabitans soyangensis]|uniref:Thioredoxin domain-containing protein n=1 Tax=Lacihabitans soyangensis TaxID=869394 RepID=A0AAE3H5R8_9BACT|nr:thioredoxin domain-containing protein [Lacihabitans soyangensis]MCP9764534.1 thioredoxin domain-containing protein [Lacihabitans soyangensis]